MNASCQSVGQLSLFVHRSEHEPNSGRSRASPVGGKRLNRHRIHVIVLYTKKMASIYCYMLVVCLLIRHISRCTCVTADSIHCILPSTLHICVHCFVLRFSAVLRLSKRGSSISEFVTVQRRQPLYRYVYSMIIIVNLHLEQFRHITFPFPTPKNAFSKDYYGNHCHIRLLF